ncbi:MAG: PAS domain S-box protein, partial [Syntrophothermus sp.]
MGKNKSKDAQPLSDLEVRLLKENEDLKIRLQEAEDALRAIREGEVDAIVISGTDGKDRIFSLTSAETPYRIIIERMEEGAVILNEAGEILYSNMRFSTMTGLANEKIIGSKISLFIEQEDLAKFNHLVKDGSQQRSSGEFRLVTAAEQQEFCLFTFSPLSDQAEGHTCVIVSNITDIKKYEQHLSWMVRERTLELEQSNQRLRHDIEQRIQIENQLVRSEHLMNYFLDNVPVGIIRWDSSGPITFANDHFLSMVGYSGEDLAAGRLDWTRLTLPEYEERDKLAFEEFWATGKCYPYEKAYYRKDGGIVPIMISSVLVDKEKNEGIGFILDLTEIKQKEERLQKSELMLMEAQKLALIGSWEYDLGTNTIFWSDNFYKIYGLDPAETEPSLENLLNAIHPDDRKEVRQGIAESLKNFTPYSSRYRIVVNNRTKHIYTVARVIRDENGKNIKILGSSQDITETILNEQRLRESEQQARKLFNELLESEKKNRELIKYAPTAIYEIDFINNKFTSVNEAMTLLSGYTQEELFTMNPLDLLEPESQKIFAARLEEARRGDKPKKTVEYKVRGKGGKQIEGLLNIQFKYDENNQLTGALVIGQDITERKKMEKLVEKSLLEAENERNKLKALLQGSSSAIIIMESADGNVVFSNEQAKKLYGMDPVSLNSPDNPKLELLKMDRVPYQADELPSSRTFLKGEVIIGEELIISRPDDTEVVVSVNSTPLYGKDGHIEATIAVFDDITHRKETERALVETHRQAMLQKHRLETFYKVSPLGIIIVEKDHGKFTFVNDAAIKILGADVTGLQVNEIKGITLLRPDAQPMDWKDYPGNRSMSTGEIVDGEEVLVQRPDGVRIPVLVYSAPFYNSDGNIEAVIAKFQDITSIKEDKKQLEYQSYLLENIRDAIIASDKDFRITYWNKGAENLYGWKAEEIIGKIGTEVLETRFVDTNRDEALQAAEILGGIEKEIVQKHRNGHDIHFQSAFNILKDQQGKITNYITVNRDLTERNKMEKSLRESEGRFQMIFRNNPVGIAISSLTEGIFVDVNDSFTVIFGYQRDELIGKTADDLNSFIIPETRETFIKALTQKGKISDFETLIRRKDGEILNILVSAEIINLNNKNHIIYAVRDITDRTKAEKALFESQSKFQAALSSMMDSIFISDANGRLVHCNDAFYTFHHFTRDENAIVAEDYFRTFELHTADGNIVPEDLRPLSRALKGERVINTEYLVRKKETGEEWFSSYSASPILNNEGEISGAVVVTRDITERKAMENALKESEERYSTIFRHSPIAIALNHVPDLKVTMVNESLENLLELKAEEIIGHNGFSFGNMSPEILADIHQKIVKDGIIRNYEASTLDSRNNPIHLILNVTSVYINNEEYYLTTIMDVTERKRMEEAILERERENALLANIIEVSSHAIAFSSLEGEILFTNHAFEDLTGYTPEELKNKHWNSLLTAPEFREAELQMRNEVLKSGIPRRFEKDYIRKDGSRVPIEVMLNTKKDRLGNPQFFFAFITDISERKRNEQNLHRLIRTLRAMQKSSQLLIHARNEIRFLKDVCEIIVKDCGHELVWIGYKQNDEKKSVKPVAFYGFDETYIEGLEISWDDTPKGRGPTGRAIREGKT